MWCSVKSRVSCSRVSRYKPEQWPGCPPELSSVCCRQLQPGRPAASSVPAESAPPHRTSSRSPTELTRTRGGQHHQPTTTNLNYTEKKKFCILNSVFVFIPVRSFSSGDRNPRLKSRMWLFHASVVTLENK